MLKRMLCKATIEWEVKCEGPLLIADGRYDKNDIINKSKVSKREAKKIGYPDKFFISRTPYLKVEELVLKSKGKAPTVPLLFYIPGTSIRGPFRAHAERILRTVLPEPTTACDPFSQEKSCSKRLESKKEQLLYAHACPACRIFGCAGLGSRIQFTDADIADGYGSVYRDMIGIDRFTGGVSQGSAKKNDGGEGGGAKMRFHALERAVFRIGITITNYELWQLGLLAYVFRDFAQGLVPIGFGKTKGFGRVTGNVTAVTLSYAKKSEKFEHMGSLMETQEERDDYGISEKSAGDLDKPEKQASSLWFHRLNVTNYDAFFREAAEHFNQYVKKHQEKTS